LLPLPWVVEGRERVGEYPTLAAAFAKHVPGRRYIGGGAYMKGAERTAVGGWRRSLESMWTSIDSEEDDRMLKMTKEGDDEGGGKVYSLLPLTGPGSSGLPMNLCLPPRGREYLICFLVEVQM